MKKKKSKMKSEREERLGSVEAGFDYRGGKGDRKDQSYPKGRCRLKWNSVKTARI